MNEATFQWADRPQVVTEVSLAPAKVEQERKFALVDISVTFPPGLLTVITGEASISLVRCCII